MPDLTAGPPPIPPDLVEFLEALWPASFPMADIGPDPHAVAAAMHRRAGRLDVIGYLRDHLNRQSQSAPRPARARKTASS